MKKFPKVFVVVVVFPDKYYLCRTIILPTFISIAILNTGKHFLKPQKFAELLIIIIYLLCISRGGIEFPIYLMLELFMAYVIELVFQKI